MRKPKKLTALLLALTLLFACAACGSGNSTNRQRQNHLGHAAGDYRPPV